MSLRRLPYQLADRAAATRDQPRLRAARPDLAAALDAVKDDDADLRKVYARYVDQVSRWDWAVSWPTVCLLNALCETVQPRKILDLGSGLSTYVFARWAKRCGEDIELVSVDDSPEWLAKTREFLASEDLSARFIDVAEFHSLTRSVFDLAFDDLGRIEVRAEAIDTLVHVMAPGAVVVLDDMNVRGYRSQVRAKLVRQGWPLYSVRQSTIDAKGRFAMLTCAPRT